MVFNQLLRVLAFESLEHGCTLTELRDTYSVQEDWDLFFQYQGKPQRGIREYKSVAKKKWPQNHTEKHGL
jgi:hypothetical protein